MDTEDKSGSSDDLKENFFTFIIHMKKMDVNNALNSGKSTALLHQQTLANKSHSTLSSSGDSNNNNNNCNNHSTLVVSDVSDKSNKNESSSGKKAFYKLIFNKSSSGSNNDTNNNNNNNSTAAPPLNNSYTKVSMERTLAGNLETKISQMSIDQNRQISTSPQGNSLQMNQTSIDLNRRLVFKS